MSSPRILFAHPVFLTLILPGREYRCEAEVHIVEPEPHDDQLRLAVRFCFPNPWLYSEFGKALAEHTAACLVGSIAGCALSATEDGTVSVVCPNPLQHSTWSPADQAPLAARRLADQAQSCVREVGKHALAA